jgi:hypothetical protein
MAGQRSNRLNYVPTLFSYRYWKPAYLLAFLTFNRFACVALFNLVEPNSEVNGHHGHQANRVQNRAAGKHQPRAAVPAPWMNCSRANSDQYRLGDMPGTSDRNRVTEKTPKIVSGVTLIAAPLTVHGLHSFLRYQRNHDERRDRVSAPPSQSRIQS